LLEASLRLPHPLLSKRRWMVLLLWMAQALGLLAH